MLAGPEIVVFDDKKSSLARDIFGEAIGRLDLKPVIFDKPEGVLEAIVEQTGAVVTALGAITGHPVPQGFRDPFGLDGFYGRQVLRRADSLGVPRALFTGNLFGATLIREGSTDLLLESSASYYKTAEKLSGWLQSLIEA